MLKPFGTSDWDIGFDVTVDGTEQLVRHMQTLLPEVKAALELRLRKDADDMRDRAKALASGDLLQSRTGRYVASIRSEVRTTSDSVFGYVESDDPRADLFEYGGAQQPRDILPSVAQALRFAGHPLLAKISLGTIGEVYAAIVHRPVVQYEKRPVIHEAFDESKEQVTIQVGLAVIGGIQNTLGEDIDAGAHSIAFTQ